MSPFLKLITTVVVSVILTSCVTTSNSRFEQKKDLAKAETTYIQIGYGHFQNGNMLQAKKAFIKALDLNSKSGGAHMGLARVYDRELEQKLAMSHFNKAIKFDGSTESYFQYGIYLYNRGDLKGAYKQLNEVLKDTVYARRAQTFEYQGVITSRLGKTEEAISNFRKAIALNPMLANSHIGLTNIYFEKGDFPTAYNHYQGFVRLVRAQLARHSASTLWLGIQLADFAKDSDAISSLSLQLRVQYGESTEYKNYLEWKSTNADKDAA
jgi:type IV pilus assembly protein PilF